MDAQNCFVVSPTVKLIEWIMEICQAVCLSKGKIYLFLGLTASLRSSHDHTPIQCPVTSGLFLALTTLQFQGNQKTFSPNMVSKRKLKGVFSEIRVKAQNFRYCFS